jgi:hypothetical protein
VSECTVLRYLDPLCSVFLVRRLPPFHAHLKEREVRSPKIHLRDSGLPHMLLGHPKAGASFEGFAIRQVAERLGAAPEECFSWGVHAGPSRDLLGVRGRRRLGFGIKLSSAPCVTRSVRAAMTDLRLETLDVVHAATGVRPPARALTGRRIRSARAGKGRPGGACGS